MKQVEKHSHSRLAEPLVPEKDTLTALKASYEEQRNKLYAEIGTLTRPA